MNEGLGRTLVIANPAAHSGDGAAAAERVEKFFSSHANATDGLELRLTQAPGDGMRMARESADFDTIVALGGDGIIHEVANGLMAVASRERPALAVVPVGSGNDFARTIGAATNDPIAALGQILRGRRRELDLGHVASDTGESGYFVQTLSFGLDAAIALDTTYRRAAQTHQKGSGLFATSGVKILSKVRGEASGYPSRVTMDGEKDVRLNSIVFAVQNGPTYGGGFRICPDAEPYDGNLNLCYNVSVPALPHVLALFALARTGRHVGSRAIATRRVRHLHIEFLEREPPCQVDGEPLHGRTYDVEVRPRSLALIAPAQ
ncbi:diacylglycerol/lipid kinase family protein [Parafannyhessea umbonata]|uniref:diacylglycerol/lipid kinase family protein n=1 Tax=Parafannyhessea umbonata TaxID=604330 RepID=UPI003F9C775C